MASFGLGSPSSQDPSSAAAEMDASTPWIAASDGNLPLLQNSLAELNIPVTAADENGYTLLHAASAYAQIHVMEWLITKGVPVNAVDSDGDTPLHHVDDVSAAQLLIEKGKANPMIPNSSGKTPLQVKLGDLEELMEDEDDDDSDEAAKLRELISYISSVTANPPQ
jgi:hypothetical protein